MPTVSAVIDEELHRRLTNWKLRTLHGSTSESVKILLTFGLDAVEGNGVCDLCGLSDHTPQQERDYEHG